MNDMRETTVGIVERPDIAWMKADGGITGQMGRFNGERIGIPAEHHGRSTQRQAAIDPAKAFQKPAAEKSRAAGYEKAFSADLFPEIAGAFEDEIEVGGEGVIGTTRLAGTFVLDHSGHVGLSIPGCSDELSIGLETRRSGWNLSFSDRKGCSKYL